MIDKIIITGDFSRVSNKKLEQAKNIEWLFNILKTSLEFTVENKIKMFPSLEDKYLVDLFLNEIGIMGIESWITRYNSNIVSERAKNMLKEVFENSVVICLEMPTWLENFLDEINCIVIEVIFHPVRFMSDLLLGFASKNEHVNDILKEFSLPIFNMYNEANLIKSYNQRLSNSSFFSESENYLLITGQMDIDRSLICDLHLKSIYNYENELKAYAKEYNYVLYKPHPYMAKDAIKREDLKNQIIFLKSIFTNVKVTNNDFYWLVSQKEVRKVVSISSGTGIEAIFFNKESDFLYKYQWSVDGQKSESKFFHAINQSFLYPDFWEKILFPFINTKSSLFNKEYQKNRLRKTIIQSWGFSLTDLGSEERLLNIDKENKQISDQNISILVNDLKNNNLNFSKLDIEFKKIANNKEHMKDFLTRILSNLTNENKVFILKILLNSDQSSEIKEHILEFSFDDIKKLLLTVGKFGPLNKLDISIIIAKLGK
jgi:hypothetical protein